MPQITVFSGHSGAIESEGQNRDGLNMSFFGSEFVLIRFESRPFLSGNASENLSLKPPF